MPPQVLKLLMGSSTMSINSISRSVLYLTIIYLIILKKLTIEPYTLEIIRFLINLIR